MLYRWIAQNGKTGRFLAAMLEIVMKWHASKEVFEKECVGYPGFVTKFRVTTAEKSGAGGGDDHVDYENYRHVCHKWHYKIAKALVVCLESKDYVQIRNALTILFKILPFFPVLTSLGGVIEKRIEKVCSEEKEQRKYLFVIATSYMGQLKSRKPLLLKETDFHLTKKGANGPSSNGNNISTSSSPSTEGPKKSAGKLTKKSSEAVKKSAEVVKKSSESKKEGKVKGERSSSSRDTSSRSQSREKSSSTRRSEGREGEERKSSKKEGRDSSSRESNSRERSAARDSVSKDKPRDEKDSSRQSRDRSRRHELGPPATSTTPSTGGQRRSTEPAEERDIKRRKVEHPSTAKDKAADQSAVLTNKVSTKRSRSKEQQTTSGGHQNGGASDLEPRTSSKQGGSSSRRREGGGGSSAKAGRK